MVALIRQGMRVACECGRVVKTKDRRQETGDRGQRTQDGYSRPATQQLPRPRAATRAIAPCCCCWCSAAGVLLLVFCCWCSAAAAAVGGWAGAPVKSLIHTPSPRGPACLPSLQSSAYENKTRVQNETTRHDTTRRDATRHDTTRRDTHMRCQPSVVCPSRAGLGKLSTFIVGKTTAHHSKNGALCVFVLLVFACIVQF